MFRTDPGGNNADSYLGRRTKCLIAGGVFALHCALVFCPLLFLALWEYFDPPVAVMKVSLVDSPPNEFDSPSYHPSADNPVPNPDPEPLSEIPSVPDLPTEIPDVPDLPVPPPPEPEPEPEPEPTKKAQAVPPPPPAKQPEKTTQPRKTEKPKRRMLRPEDITISRKRVVSNRSAVNSSAARETARRNREYADMLRNLGRNSLPAGGGGGPRGDVTISDLEKYYKKVQDFLHPQWNQPSSRLLEGRTDLAVDVVFQITADGRIQSAQIREKSGIPAMDASVEELIRKVKVLPAPPKAMTLTITLRVK